MIRYYRDEGDKWDVESGTHELMKLRNDSRSRNGCEATAGLAIAEARASLADHL